jgi:uncharacterized protein YjbJ (UPF0337 family)
LRLVWALGSGEADRGPCRWRVTAPPEGEVIPVSTRDKARNTARAAKGKAKRAAGKAAGNPYAQAAGARKKKANPKQAGEKLKDTAKK